MCFSLGSGHTPADFGLNMPPLSPTATQELIRKVASYVQSYMLNFDGSHDYNHILRVLGLARRIAAEILEDPANATSLDPTIVTLAALMHDVGDRKYLKEGDNPETMVRDVLLEFGASRDLAVNMQRICGGVSYSSEMKDPAKVMELVSRYPELAVVQDADRLDAIGAVGIGRVFMYGGAKTTRGLAGCLDMFDSKLMLVEASMKTMPGRRLAKERTRRLAVWREWYLEEVGTMVERGMWFRKVGWGRERRVDGWLGRDGKFESQNGNAQ